VSWSDFTPMGRENTINKKQDTPTTRSFVLHLRVLDTKQEYKIQREYRFKDLEGTDGKEFLMGDLHESLDKILATAGFKPKE
jgi:hypothetical protein